MGGGVRAEPKLVAAFLLPEEGDGTPCSAMISSESTEAARFAGANIAGHLGRMARAQPKQAALKIPRGRDRAGSIDYLTLDFRALDAEVGAWCARLTAAGIRPGDRTLVMVRQGLPLIAAVFALFNIGAVPVVIDPGMGRRNFLAAVARTRPRALVGIPTAQILSWIFRPSFRSVMIRVTAPRGLTARLTGDQPGEMDAPAPPAFAAGSADTAAILFTSGSTGAPKGVVYAHGMFEAQVRMIRETYGIRPGEVDLPLLPIFALFNPALGMTTIVPEIDPRKPAAFNPAQIVQAIQQENVTNSFGSPTLWRKISEHCAGRGVTLPSLRRVLCAGAAVPTALWKSSQTLLPHGQLHSPYGATEALPVATIAASEVDLASVAGACVGKPLREMTVKIIALVDAPLASWAEVEELPPGQIGEIIVRGPVVTQAYAELPDATAWAKISEGPPEKNALKPGLISESVRAGEGAGVNDGLKGGRWHRMGDCGYLDLAGRLWYCGRKVERVFTSLGPFYSEPCEQVFRGHPRAARCALIGIGGADQRRAALVVETKIKDSAEGRALTRELRALALRHAHTSGIKVYYFHENFPVDVRHNAKIHRLALATWAKTARGFQSDPKR